MELKQTAVIEFDYNIETLEKFKAEVSLIDRKDIDKVQVAVKELVKMRGSIEKKGKTYRDDANAFNKMVLGKEKEYVGIIEPLELELKEVLVREEKRKIIEARKELLSMKKQQLSLLKITQPTDEELLSMNEEEWIAFYNQKFSEHNEFLVQEEKRKEEEKARLEREAEREEQIKKEAEEIKREAEERAEKQRVELLKKAEEDKIKAVEEEKRKAERAEQDRIEKERLEKEREIARLNAIKVEEEAEKARVEADTKYKQFLSDNNYNPVTDIINRNGNEISIYRLVNSFNLN